MKNLSQFLITIRGEIHDTLILSRCFVSKVLKFTEKGHCEKSVRIHSYFGPYFPAFGLNTERYYSVPFCIQSEWGEIRTRITPNTGLFTQWVFTHGVYCKYFNYSQNMSFFGKFLAYWSVQLTI